MILERTSLAARIAGFLATATTAATVLAAEPTATPPPLEPFVATYAVVWKGISAGRSELNLRRQPDGRFLYSSRSSARGLVRLIIRDEIQQTTTVEIGPQGVRPLHYRGDDGSDDTDRDVSLDFNWNAGTITGVAEDKKVRLELPAGVQDPMSIQLALIDDLRNGREISGYQMADKDEVKSYVYNYVGTERIETDIGTLDTVVYSSHREGSTKRITRMWHAPSLGFIPVKAERMREGKREFAMEIRSLERG